MNENKKMLNKYEPCNRTEKKSAKKTNDREFLLHQRNVYNVRAKEKSDIKRNGNEFIFTKKKIIFLQETNNKTNDLEEKI